MARKVPQLDDVRVAVEAVSAWLDDPSGPEPVRTEIAAAVRNTARYLAAQNPGGAVELRVPPYVAVQCVAGLDHRRGTPPNVVEISPRTWLLLATGRQSWAQATDEGAISASGSRADLSAVLPVVPAV